MTWEEAVKKDLNTALSELVQQAFWTGYKAATDKIVHCKDCKYGEKRAKPYMYCDIFGAVTETEWFCSKAERKEE